MNKQIHQNILFSLFITALGMMINFLHTVADHMALSLGRAASQAGLLISIYALGSLTSVVLSSALADWAGKRRVILAALGVMFVGFSILFAAHAFVPMALGLFLFGFGFGPSEGLGSAVLSDENPEQASKWVNIAHAGFGLGAIVAPMLAVASLQLSGSHHQIYLFSTILALVFIAWIALSVKRPKLSKPQQSLSPFSMFGLLKDKRMAVVALMMFLYLGYESVASAYTKQLFLSKGSSEPVSALMISLFWGSMIVGRLIGASLNGKEVLSIRLYALLAILGMVLLTFATNVPLRILAVALYGFGCGPTWPMLVVLATRLFPQRTGAAMAVMMLATMGGLTVFPYLIGTLPNNLSVTFLSAAVLAILVTLLTFQFKKEPQPQ